MLEPLGWNPVQSCDLKLFRGKVLASGLARVYFLVLPCVVLDRGMPVATFLIDGREPEVRPTPSRFHLLHSL